MKKKNLEFQNFIDKGQALYDKYGDTIKSLADMTGITKKFSIKKERADNDSECSKKATSIKRKEQKIEIPDIQKDVFATSRISVGEMRKSVENDKYFDDSLNILEKTIKRTLPKITNPDVALDAVKLLGNIASDTIRYTEEQETKREEIRTVRDAPIARIKAIGENLRFYLEKSFDERKEMFAKQIECVDRALADGNNEMLALALDSINKLAASSPFKNLSDVSDIKKSLADKNTEWDI